MHTLCWILLATMRIEYITTNIYPTMFYTELFRDRYSYRQARLLLLFQVQRLIANKHFFLDKTV